MILIQSTIGSDREITGIDYGIHFCYLQPVPHWTRAVTLYDGKKSFSRQ